MRLIPNWKAILWRSWSMRLTYLGVALVWGSAVWFALGGDLPISPTGMLVLTAGLIPLLTALGRVIDQGIGDGK